MLTKSLLISLVIPTIIISNSSSSDIRSEARTEVNGENASAKTEIITNVNGTETRVESNQPGTIKVETKNGVTSVEKSVSPIPSIVISPLPTSIEIPKEVPRTIINFLENLISRFFELFRFRT